MTYRTLDITQMLAPFSGRECSFRTSGHFAGMTSKHNYI